MNKQQIIEQIRTKKSFLCVGLDTDINKIPKHLLNSEDPVFEFNKAIIDATAQYAVAYKPNTAFYEVYGAKGWISLGKTIKYLKTNYPDIFVIADAKRGDIGNTSTNYAKAMFEGLNADAVDGGDDIILLQSGTGGGAILCHRGDAHALHLREVQLVRHVIVHLLDGDGQHGTLHHTIYF